MVGLYISSNGDYLSPYLGILTAAIDLGTMFVELVITCQSVMITLKIYCGWAFDSFYSAIYKSK